jgi:hypothetical protein
MGALARKTTVAAIQLNNSIALKKKGRCSHAEESNTVSNDLYRYGLCRCIDLSQAATPWAIRPARHPPRGIIGSGKLSI